MSFDVLCAVCSFVWQVTQEIREMLEANRAAALQAESVRSDICGVTCSMLPSFQVYLAVHNI